MWLTQLEVQRESGIQGGLNSVVLAPFSAVLLAPAPPCPLVRRWHSYPICPSQHPGKRQRDTTGHMPGSESLHPGSQQITKEAKEDVVTHGLVQLKRDLCPLRHVWCTAEGR